MTVLLLILIVCVLVAIATYVILLQSGVLPGAAERATSTKVSRMGEMPQGCLLAVIVAAGVWFLLWGAVLVLALRFLRQPFTS